MNTVEQCLPFLMCRYSSRVVLFFRDLFRVCLLDHLGRGLFQLLAAGLVCRAIAGARGCFTRLFEGDSLLSPRLLYVFRGCWVHEESVQRV